MGNLKPFKGKLWGVGTSKVITIPCKIMEILDLKEGDIILVNIKKESGNNEENKVS